MQQALMPIFTTKNNMNNHFNFEILVKNQSNTSHIKNIK
jgi:hypothetical protein